MYRALTGSHCTLYVASFPGRSHRQYFHRFKYELQRGKAGRSGHVRCHQVDTWRGVPNKYLDVLSVMSVQWRDDRYHSLFTTPGTDRHETGIMMVAPPPPPPPPPPHVSNTCLPDDIACGPDLPGLPPLYFAYCKRSNTSGGNGPGNEATLWERPGNEATLWERPGNEATLWERPGTRLPCGNGLGTRLPCGNGLGTRLPCMVWIQGQEPLVEFITLTLGWSVPFSTVVASTSLAGSSWGS